jgi:hypothetical protein
VKTKLFYVSVPCLLILGYVFVLEHFYNYAFRVYGMEAPAGPDIGGNIGPAEDVVFFTFAPRIQELLELPLGGTYFVLRSRIRSDHENARKLYFDMRARKLLEQSPKDDLNAFVKNSPEKQAE